MKIIDILKRITDYIEKHKWLINEKIPFTITLDQAFYSWYENVFFPQWHEMERTNILQKFRDKTPYDVYKMVSSEYFFLMEADRGVHYDKACYAVIARESKSIIAKFSAKMHLLSL
ncbi:MAG: hypothetical protein B6229_02390 [Spirochaetaceae bacterium 4572_7]|nr:MAG: hypothetical protein B6229_02390 [Spirochaetaceae bacterium 4572_7]